MMPQIVLYFYEFRQRILYQSRSTSNPLRVEFILFDNLVGFVIRFQSLYVFLHKDFKGCQMLTAVFMINSESMFAIYNDNCRLCT